MGTCFDKMTVFSHVRTWLLGLPALDTEVWENFISVVGHG